jgi:hypothetical protein
MGPNPRDPMTHRSTAAVVQTCFNIKAVMAY